MTSHEQPDLEIWTFTLSLRAPSGALWQERVPFNEHSLDEEIVFPIPGIKKRVTARLTTYIP